MAKAKLDIKKLEALGVERLAKILLDLSSTNIAVKRHLLIEVASHAGPGELASIIRKRIAAYARSQSFVDWQGIRKLAHELDQLRKMIVETLADISPQDALDMLWRFMTLARQIYERCDDSNGYVSHVFQTACQDFGALAKRAQIDPVLLADRVYETQIVNDYGQYDNLITILAGSLGEKGLEHLKDRFKHIINLHNQPPNVVRLDQRQSSSGVVKYQSSSSDKGRTARSALQEIADAQGDVDSYIAQYEESKLQVPQIAAEVAMRLIKASRVDEALAVLDLAQSNNSDAKVSDWHWLNFDWEDARISALEASHQREEAQKLRWKCFELSLSKTHLKDYLKHLPDFDDMEAEIKAFEFAQKFRHHSRALAFFINWPSLDQASQFILTHASLLDGNYYEVLTPAAEALAAKYPLSATLALRSMIDFTLMNARSSRYRHAARHLAECKNLAKNISDFGSFETHVSFVNRLLEHHDRKTSFWSMKELAGGF